MLSIAHPQSGLLYLRRRKKIKTPFSVLARLLVFSPSFRFCPLRRMLKMSIRTVGHCLLESFIVYKHLPSYLEINYTVSDVKVFQELLINSLGFPRNHVVTLLDEDAILSGIKAEIARLADRKDDRVLIYFSGHGQTVPLPGSGEMGYLITHDARINLLDPVPNPAEYYATCLGMDELKRLSRLISAKHVLFLIDACYSGLAISARDGLAS